jgi:hypothetical protein
VRRRATTRVLEEAETHDHMNKKPVLRVTFEGKPGELVRYEEMLRAPRPPEVQGYELRLNTRNGVLEGRQAARNGAQVSL